MSSNLHGTVVSTSSSRLESGIFSDFDLKNLLTSSQTLTVGAILIAWVAIALLFPGKKGRLATSYWGGSRERAIARQKALAQIKNPKRNEVSFYIGTPKVMREKLERAGVLERTPIYSQLLSNDTTLYLPDGQRSILTMGGPGCGKTHSVNDPVLRSAVDQGFPICLYDFKYPAQTKRLVAYAMKRGYRVNIFAPGFPESDICNPLDLIKDEEDAVSAAQLIEVISKNTDKSHGKASGDKFFEEAGDTLTEGIFLVTKAVEKLTGSKEFCDLMMASAILDLPNLANRIEMAADTGKLGIWTSKPFSQLISVKDSEKTVAGIVGTAQRLFQRFLKKEFLGAFCGETTLPLDLDGRQLLIFGMNRNNRDIVGGLLTAVLHMIISRNISRSIPREKPFIFGGDEIPTLYLPYLVNWINEAREDGFCGVISCQNQSQLEDKYGREKTQAIIGGCGTKAIFNPQDPVSAKSFSDMLGETDAPYSTSSRSTGKGGSSRSKSENLQKKALFEPAQFNKLSTGECVIINPAFKRGKESYVPLLMQIKIPRRDLEEQKWSESRWEVIREAFIKRRGESIDDDTRRTQFDERKALAEQLFSMPGDDFSNGGVRSTTPPPGGGTGGAQKPLVSSKEETINVDEQLHKMMKQAPLPQPSPEQPFEETVHELEENF